MNRWVGISALLAAVIAVGLACTSSSSDGSTDSSPDELDRADALEDQASEAPAASSNDVSEGAEAGGSESDDIGDLEQRWAASRDRMVNRIDNAGFGLSPEGVLLTGPARFQLLLSDCPDNWRDDFDDGPIRLGLVLPQSGALSGFDSVADGIRAYVDYVNDQHGGVDGRRIELQVEDDGYDPDRTADAVDRLLARDDVFSVTTLGSPTSLEVYQDLNDACVPHPFVMSPHPAWGDPVNYPWTSGLQLSYTTEAQLWGAWIESNLSDQLPVTVGALVLDNENGEAYEAAFAEWAELHPEVVEEFITERHAGTALSVADEMEALAEQDPDVYVSMTFGNACVDALREADRTGLIEQVLVRFNPSVCRDTTAYLDPVGDAADGIFIVDGGWKLATDPQLASDPFIGWTRSTLDRYGLDPEVGLHSIGFAQYGWTLIEVLRVAAELEGGLSRSNFMLALRALDVDHPLASPGVTLTLNGARDAYPVEGSSFATFDVERRAWIQVGMPIDINGTTPPCPWTGSRCG